MKKNSTISKRRIVTAVLMILPAAVLICVFTLYPMLMTVYYAFTNITLTGANASNASFIGLQNFFNVIHDPKFGTIMKNTLQFLLFSGIIGQQIFGFFLASLMKKKNKQIRRFTGFTVVLGWITPEIVAAYMFGAYFNKKGILNAMLAFSGLPRVPWTFDYPMLSIVIANIWKGSAYSMMMFQAALDSIPDEIIESAKIDGANWFDVLTRITLPLIKNTIATTFIMVTLGTLGTFGMIYAFTGGGPGVKTTTLSVYMYTQAFNSYQVGYGMAIALIILLIGSVLSIINLRAMKIDKD